MANRKELEVRRYMLFKRNELKRPCKYGRKALRQIRGPYVCSGCMGFPERCDKCRIYVANNPIGFMQITHAKWIERERYLPFSTKAICYCSACGAYCWVYDNPDRRFKYCPFCGAKMDIEESDAEQEEGEQT